MGLETIAVLAAAGALALGLVGHVFAALTGRWRLPTAALILLRLLAATGLAAYVVPPRLAHIESTRRLMRGVGQSISAGEYASLATEAAVLILVPMVGLEIGLAIARSRRRPASRARVLGAAIESCTSPERAVALIERNAPLDRDEIELVAPALARRSRAAGWSPAVTYEERLRAAVADPQDAQALLEALG